MRLHRPLTLLACSTVMTALAGAAHGVTVTLLHNNDGESKLTGGANYGDAATFVTLVNQLKGASTNPIMISSGDNFLPGTAFAASLNDGVFYDAIAVNAIGYDAIVLGNHDFDFGPDVLADFIGAVDPNVPYLSANLDFSGEADLQQLQNQGRIARSTVVDRGGERIAIVGATTERLPTISSPRNVTVGDVRNAVQAEIDRLQNDEGVNKVILVSHLQGINEDLELIPQLRGVDVAIAGGGDEILVNDPSQLVPGDVIDGPYPVTSTDYTPAGDGVLQLTNADGRVVPVVTTGGEYKYLGALEVEFDSLGNVVAFDGDPLPNIGYAQDTQVYQDAVQPVAAYEAQLDQNVIATSEVPLDGVRDNVRSMQTNFGALIADALLWQAQQRADEFGVDAPTVAFQNGGGIRNNSVLPAGDITELNTFQALPFPNFVAIIPDVPVLDFVALLENAVSAVENFDGRFAQVAGVQFRYDPDADPGQRIVDITLGDVMQIVEDRRLLVPPSFTIDVATIDFLARGGDGYPLEQFDFTSIGVSYQQALFNFLQQGLNGFVSADDYGAQTIGRIFTAPGEGGGVLVIPTPAAASLGLALLGLAAARRRRTR